MRLLCRIGIHGWQEATVAQYKMEHVSAIVTGDQCRHCGQLRESWEEITRLLPEPHKWERYSDRLTDKEIAELEARKAKPMDFNIIKPSVGE